MINWESLNGVDYFILVVFFFSILTGLSRGLVKEVISLLAFIAAIVVASMFAQKLALSFIGQDTSQAASYAVIGASFALIFICTLLVGSLVGAIVGFFFQTGPLGFLNRLLGGVFGVGRGFLLSLVLIFLFQLTAFANYPWWQQSQMVNAFQPAVVRLGEVVSPALADMKGKLNQTVQTVTQTVTQTVQDAATAVTNAAQ